MLFEVSEWVSTPSSAVISVEDGVIVKSSHSRWGTSVGSPFHDFQIRFKSLFKTKGCVLPVTVSRLEETKSILSEEKHTLIDRLIEKEITNAEYLGYQPKIFVHP